LIEVRGTLKVVAVKAPGFGEWFVGKEGWGWEGRGVVCGGSGCQGFNECR
jgi:hypothetical protein